MPANLKNSFIDVCLFYYYTLFFCTQLGKYLIIRGVINQTKNITKTSICSVSVYLPHHLLTVKTSVVKNNCLN